MGALPGHMAPSAPTALHHGTGCPPPLKDCWWPRHPPPWAAVANGVPVYTPTGSVFSWLVPSALMTHLASSSRAFAEAGDSAALRTEEQGTGHFEQAIHCISRTRGNNAPPFAPEALKSVLSC